MPHADREARRASARARYANRSPAQVEADRARARAHYVANRERLLSRFKEQYAEDPEPKREQSRRAAQKLRDEFIEAYGGKCKCCGETEPRFLCLDHINRDGVRDRATTSGRNTGVIRRLRRQGWPKDGYRLLCANCNMATAWGRTCPHQEREVA